MSERVENFTIGLSEDLAGKLVEAGYLFSAIRILRKSVDARRKTPHWVYTLDLLNDGEPIANPLADLKKISGQSFTRPIIVGAGPAGLFAALRLAERGLPPILLERGSKTVKRLLGITQYWRYGKLDPENNVCFGEGGAGLYSDGKLITRIRSEHIPYVMDRFIKFGAPEEIRYLANPHVGSDQIRKLIVPLREYLQALGTEIHFDAKVENLLLTDGRIQGLQLKDGREFKSDHVVLATGHSASDLMWNLPKWGVQVEGKSFALGLRIEHPQTLVNKIQYGDFWNHPELGAANYKITDHDEKTGVGVYSFCMCPGGYVVASSAEANRMVSNGMSNYKRNSPYANAGIVISIDHQKMFGRDVFGGMRLRDELEQKSFEISNAVGKGKEVPVQRVVDFLDKKVGTALPSSSPSGAVPGALHKILPASLQDHFLSSLHRLHRKMPGFLSPEAQFHAIESRTSCPIRVTRHEDSLESLSHRGLYPTGEGAGYAGGITSAAVDGIRVAESILRQLDS